MTGGLVEGAILGAVFQEVAKPITGQVSKALKFKTTRRKLKSIVDRNTPVAKEMKLLDDQLDRPKEESQRLIEELEQGKELVKKHSKVPWWKFCCLPCYQGELQDMDRKVARSSSLVTPVIMARDVKETLSIVRGIQGQGRQFNGLLCKPPEKLDLTVGLDVPLIKLKNWLLQDSTGVSVLVLTGLAGSGKTTLATLLCWDDQVKGKFGENILFLTVSKSPDLKIIVHTLYGHCGLDEPGMVDDEQAVKLLRSLLKKIGETSPVMLVLDNVWPGSESLVEKFRIQVKDCKILVTSRVEFPRFTTSIFLKPLSLDDAVTLFRHFALPNDGTRISYIPDEEFVQQVARGCWCSPLALELIGTSLCGQPITVWQKMKNLLSEGRSLIASNDGLLNHLSKVLDDALDDKPLIKECFMDLGLFPEDQEIPVAALIDMWTELNNLDDGNIDGMNIVHELNKLHLVNLVVKTTREVTSHIDNYYNHHFLTQHDLLKEIAIHQAMQEPFEQRKRLILDVNDNSWPQQNQQNAIARTLSISTDKMLTPDWSSIVKAEEVEVLILNLRTNKYTLPEWIRKMTKLKVLIVTNSNGFQFAELDNFEILGCLPNLRRIRLQQVSVPPFCKMYNLRKLSLYNCETSQFFQSDVAISFSKALPNLEELSVDYCKGLVKLPAGLCDITFTSFMKLSITRCIKFLVLPQEIEKLKKLKVLRLSSCAVLREIPASIGKLPELHLLDISGCVSLQALPEEIGNLHNLKELHMTGDCSSPGSVAKLQNLKLLTCDEETALFWEQNFKPSLPNLKIVETIDDKLFITV